MPVYRQGNCRLEPGPTVIPAWVAGQRAPPKGKTLPPYAKRRELRTRRIGLPEARVRERGIMHPGIDWFGKCDDRSRCSHHRSNSSCACYVMYRLP